MSRDAIARARAIAAAPLVPVLVVPALVSALEKVQHSSALSAEEAIELQSLYVQLGCAMERAAEQVSA